MQLDAPAHDGRLELSLQAKIGHLGRPGSYPDFTSRVEVVETHMSVVFLTDSHAYKLKKPVRHSYLDFTTLEARRVDCLEEVRLNRRLAPSVYLGAVALAATPAGLVLEGEGAVVEWLVKMRRLPREAMLDHALAAGTATPQAIDRCLAVLCAFYRTCAPAPLEAGAYRDRFRRDAETNRIELADPAYALSRARVDAVVDRLLRFTEARSALLDGRISQGRIVEGHGDLRPEHVCLAPEPLFIDCLEFDAGLRTLDTADEAAYLALECECAGAAGVASEILAAYRRHARDDAGDALVRFYQCQRALLRAKLAAWHVKDGLNGNARERWLGRARRYLDWAAAHLPDQ